MKIKTILWDVDGTLLDFSMSEKVSLSECMDEIGFHSYDDEMIKRYAAINRRYWEALERGELSKPEVLIGRFRDFFQQEHILCDDIERFNENYQNLLGKHFFVNDNCIELCQQLQGTVRQYVVTNGTVTAQKNKLQGSGLIHCMDGVFISDEIGIEKPGIGFFDCVFQTIQKQTGEVPDPSEMLIVGDSLTSDMTGGNRAGIRCCWYNPSGKLNHTDVHIDYEIKNLWEIKNMII